MMISCMTSGDMSSDMTSGMTSGMTHFPYRPQRYSTISLIY